MRTSSDGKWWTTLLRREKKCRKNLRRMNSKSVVNELLSGINSHGILTVLLLWLVVSLFYGRCHRRHYYLWHNLDSSLNWNSSAARVIADRAKDNFFLFHLVQISRPWRGKIEVLRRRVLRGGEPLKLVIYRLHQIKTCKHKKFDKPLKTLSCIGMLTQFLQHRLTASWP